MVSILYAGWILIDEYYIKNGYDIIEMILLSNHLLTLSEFKNIKDVVIRINMAYVKDIFQLEKFVNIDYDIFLDYPKGRTKPPKPILHIPDALDIMKR